MRAMTKAWIPFLSACDLVFASRAGERLERLMRALRAGAVKSRGRDTSDEWKTKAIPLDLWARWTFNTRRQSLDPHRWRKIPTGFAEVQVSRIEVEALILPPAERALATPRTPKSKSRRAPTLAEGFGQKLRERFGEDRPVGQIQALAQQVVDDSNGRLRMPSQRSLIRAINSAWPKSAE